MNKIFSIKTLAAIVGLCAFAGSATVSAQSTAGSVFGKAPAGYAISAHSITTGVGRTVHSDERGRYSIHNLPVGIYTVTLENGDKAVARHVNVSVVVARGSEVDFDCSKLHCGELASK